MHWYNVLEILDIAFVPIIAVVAAILGIVLIVRGKLGKLEIGNLKLSSEVQADALQAISVGDPKTPERQYALLRQYHAQGLAQSRISFWFSLVFASIGFLIIVLAVITHVLAPTEPGAAAVAAGALSSVEKAAKPIFAVVAGTIIDAVAALFFVQSNKARQLMTEFFDKLRVDRKLDESLRVLNAIHDKTVASRVRALLALNFADVDVGNDVFQQIVAGDAERLDGIPAVE